jgi:hypothetical protein
VIEGLNIFTVRKQDIDLGGLYVQVIGGLNVFINRIVGYIDLGGLHPPLIRRLNDFANSTVGYIEL